MMGPEMTIAEFNRALKDLSKKKATGIDGIPAELLKNMDHKTKTSLFQI